MSIPPYFVAANNNSKTLLKAAKLIPWKEYDCVIKNFDGKVYFEMKGVKAPAQWSQLSVDITASKYFRKTGVPKAGTEKSVGQMVERVVNHITRFALKQKYFSGKKKADIFAEELKYILYTQKAFFNSPVWFNCGLYESYKIQSHSSCWFWNPTQKKIEHSFEAYKYPQVSACFIQSLEDNMESIFRLLETEARLFKYGSGSGTNFSRLRSKHEKLSSGGLSSGLISFLEIFDKAAGSIKSGGTTRRAAKMVCVDVDHPEIIEFIEWKKNEEKKAQALIREGYPSDFEGEAYKTVSGQNSNNSVRVTNAFFKALEQGADWDLHSRSSSSRKNVVVNSVKAKDIWQKICESAWDCADPGLQYHDTIQQWHTCSKDGEIRASNPCSEYMFLDDSACNLASLNLLSFLNENGEFNFSAFAHTVKVVFLAQEILVDLAGYPTEKIAKNSHDFRTLGIGLCGLGAFLMRKGVAYDSEEGRAWGSYIAALMQGEALRTSCEVAKVKGAFAGFKKNKSQMQRVVKLHHQAQKKIPEKYFNDSEKKFLNAIWKEVLVGGQKYGYRNAQLSVMAPTGTIGLVLDCDTTGIEPEFSLTKFKKLAGGGDLKIVSQSVRPALQALQYSESHISDILAHLEKTSTIEGAPHLKPEHYSVFDCAHVNGNGKRFLSADAHLQMMAAIQPFVSGSISKTVNLPNSATVKDVSDIYMQAWKLGLKCVSIYRDGSKWSQPLKTAKVSEFPACPQCGFETVLQDGCYVCTNCGSSTSCSV